MERKVLNTQDIEKLIPHRKPFMFLASAEIIEPGIKAVGVLADLSHPDFSFLKGHFPGNLIVPGIILTEALAQLSGVALISGMKRDQDKIGVLRKSSMSFKTVVRPGESVQLEAEIIRFRMNIGISKVRANKEGSLTAEGEIIFALVNKSKT